MSKAALAGLLGVSPKAMTALETDGAPVRFAASLGRALGMPEEFFLRPEVEELRLEQCYFRSARRSTAKDLAAARAAATLGMDLYGWIEDRFHLPSVRMPELDHQSPDDAAAAFRAAWGLGGSTIPNLLQLSEAYGVRVLSLPTEAQRVDSFSFWFEGVPHVLVSTSRSAERSRFDLAHELGHLVLHSRSTPAMDVEREADEFAVALLMPEHDLMAHAGREPAAPQLLRLKEHYRVPAMAIAHRLRELGRMSDDTHRQNCLELSRRGFGVDEPRGMEPERSRVFAVALPALRETRGSQLRIELGLSPEDIHGLTFGQVPLALAGGNRPLVAARPDLTVVDQLG